LRVAARSHRHHHRKASDLPYITHPAGTAIILLKAGFDDDELLAAALLHDVVEDTDYTLDQLNAEFPPNVGVYVSALTERKHNPDGTRRRWRDRKEEHLKEVARAPLAARAIVLADKLHNLGTMLYDLDAGEDIWTRFSAPPHEIFWYHREMIDCAARDDQPLQPLANACSEFLNRLEATIATT
jgi:(p)ppGpp synthase/HD superfamily hydrolase